MDVYVYAELSSSTIIRPHLPKEWHGISPHRLKPTAIVVGWGTTLAGFTLGGIFQGQLLPPQAPGNLFPEVSNTGPLGPIVFYTGILSISVIAPLLINDAGRALLSFFASYLLGSVITYFALVLPAYTGAFPLPGLLSGTAIDFTFSTTFPIPLFAELAATLVGIWVSER